MRKRDWLVVAAVMVVLAVGIGLLAGWLRGDPNGTVVRKDEVGTTSCNRYGMNCRLRTCYQITYVNDQNQTRTVCVPKARYEGLQLGDRFSR